MVAHRFVLYGACFRLPILLSKIRPQARCCLRLPAPHPRIIQPIRTLPPTTGPMRFRRTCKYTRPPPTRQTLCLPGCSMKREINFGEDMDWRFQEVCNDSEKIDATRSQLAMTLRANLFKLNSLQDKSMTTSRKCWGNSTNRASFPSSQRTSSWANPCPVTLS